MNPCIRARFTAGGQGFCFGGLTPEETGHFEREEKMDSKQAWALKEEKKKELRAWRERRNAAKARLEVDVDAHQPLNEPWVWAKTLPLLDGSQLGGAIVPFADEFFAIAAAGIRTGQVTHCLASADDMKKFHENQREKKSASQASQDKIERRDRIMVQAVAPAPRGTV